MGFCPPVPASQILGDGGRVRLPRRPSSERPCGRFPVSGQHDFGCGCAARRQFGREPNPATVRRQARLDTGGAGGGGEAALNLQRRQPDHPIRGRGVGTVGAT